MHDIITIYVTHNGYSVYVGIPDGYGQLQTTLKSYTFESIKKLQDSLPKILNQPVEKRKPIKGNQP